MWIDTETGEIVNFNPEAMELIDYCVHVPKWLGPLNFIILQWFFIRLARCYSTPITYDNRSGCGYKIIFAWPLSLWQWRKFFK